MYLVCIVFVSWLLWTLWKRRAIYKIAWQVPGPCGYPLIGIAYYFSDPSKIVTNMRKYTEPTICKLWMGPNLFLYIEQPEDIETILNSDVCLDKGNSYTFIQKVIGLGLITLRGDDWKTHRKLLNPSFHYTIINKFIPIFNKHLRLMVKCLEQQQHRDIDILDYMKFASMDMICETTMDQRTNTQLGENGAYLEAVHYILIVTAIRMFKPWLQPEFLFKLSSYSKAFQKNNDILFNRVDEIIKTKSKEVIEKKKTVANMKCADSDEGGSKEKLLFIDRVLKLAMDEQKFTINDVLNETNTVLLAGFETTATSAAFVLLLLAMHPNYQQQLYDEVKNISLENDRDVDVDDMVHLRFLDMFIKETQRMFPAVPYLTRSTSSELKLGKYTIPPGVDFVIGVFNMHRNEAIYKNPLDFDPDNFLPENVASRHAFSFLPFSAGRRACIGTRYANNVLKLITIYVVKNFSLTTHLTVADLKFRMNITLHLMDKHWLQLHKRPDVL